MCVSNSSDQGEVMVVSALLTKKDEKRKTRMRIRSIKNKGQDLQSFIIFQFDRYLNFSSMFLVMTIL